MKYWIAILMVLIPTSVSAATIALKTEKIVCRSNEVTLGDVATVTEQQGENAQTVEALRKIVLCPAPIPGKMRVLKYSDIRNILGVRGIAMNKHFFTGAAEVTIVADSEAAQTAVTSRYDSELEQMLAAKIVSYLKQRVADDIPWNVNVSLTPEHSEIVRQCGKVLSARGGKAPFTGYQIFELQFSEKDPQSGENIIIKIGVEVSAPPMVVMAKKSIRRGAMIGPADVTLAFAGENMEPADGVLTSLDEVIGKEAAMSIRKGAIFTGTLVEKPLLIKRNDVVTVYVKNQGITIKTVGKSKQDGRLDDEIVVEQLKSNKTFTAKVTDIGVVEIQPERSQMIDTPDNNRSIRQVGYETSDFIDI